MSHHRNAPHRKAEAASIANGSYAEKASQAVPFSTIATDLARLSSPADRSLVVPENFLFMDYKKYASVHVAVARDFCDVALNATTYKINFKPQFPLPIEKVYWKVGTDVRKVSSWIGSKDHADLRQHAWDVSQHVEYFQEENESQLATIYNGHVNLETLAHEQERFVAPFRNGTAQDRHYENLIHRLLDLYASFSKNRKYYDEIRAKAFSFLRKNKDKAVVGNQQPAAAATPAATTEESAAASAKAHPSFGVIVYILKQLNHVLKGQPVVTAVSKILDADVFESFMVTPYKNYRHSHARCSAPLSEAGRGIRHPQNHQRANSLDILNSAAVDSGEHDHYTLLPECVLFYSRYGHVDIAWFRIKALMVDDDDDNE